jgi:reactive intermediate/imine deaminase
MAKHMIHTPSAPAALGTYSQGIRAGGTLYLSGQIGLDPQTGNLAPSVEAQIEQAFSNLSAVATAAGATLDDAVKLTLFLTDLAHFAKVNEIMARHFREPFPARSTVQVSALPKGAAFEVEAIVALS